MKSRISAVALAIFATIVVWVLLLSVAVQIKNRTGMARRQNKDLIQPTKTSVEVPDPNLNDRMMPTETIPPPTEFPLKFKIDGVIETFKHTVGDRIHRGDVIAQLNQRDRYLKLKKARLELEQIQQGIICFTTAPLKLNQDKAKKAVDRAILDLENTVLRSPMEGTLTHRYVEIGQPVTSTVTVATIGIPTENNALPAPTQP